MNWEKWVNRERDLLGDAWGVGGCGGCGELGGPGHGARVLDGDGPGGGGPGHVDGGPGYGPGGGGPGHGGGALGYGPEGANGDRPGGGGGAGSDWDGPILGKSIIWKNYANLVFQN